MYGKDNRLNLTLQFTKPNSSGEGGSSGETAPSVIDSVECSSIDSGLTLLNSYVSKEINLSHCKVIVISSELAARGISKEIYSLMNNVQVRPDSNIIISRSLAKDYIENAIPSLENLVAKFYEVYTQASEYTGYSVNTTIGEFFNNLTDSYYEPSAILGGVNSPSTQLSNSSSNSGNNDSTYKAEDTPFDVKNTAENMGIAVFHSDKLVGELNAIDSVSHLITTNKLDYTTISIDNPYKDSDTIDLRIEPQQKTKIKVDLVNGSPYVTLDYSLTAKIISANENFKFLSADENTNITRVANQYLETIFLEYLYKTSKLFHSDISGIGKYLIGQYTTVKDWTNYNWSENFKNSIFHVNVDTNITSSYIVKET